MKQVIKKLGIITFLTGITLFTSATARSAVGNITTTPCETSCYEESKEPTSPQLDQDNVISDLGLKRAINKHLNKLRGDERPLDQNISIAMISELTGTLDASSQGIKTAEGIAYAVNLTGLILKDNELTELNHAVPKNLKMLDASKNKISAYPSHVDWVRSTSNIEHLLLDDNEINFVPYLILGVNKAKTISLARNKITDFVKSEQIFLTLFKDLEKLDLSGNRLFDTNLANLPNPNTQVIITNQHKVELPVSVKMGQNTVTVDVVLPRDRKGNTIKPVPSNNYSFKLISNKDGIGKITWKNIKNMTHLSYQINHKLNNLNFSGTVLLPLSFTTSQ